MRSQCRCQNAGPVCPLWLTSSIRNQKGILQEWLSSSALCTMCCNNLSYKSQWQGLQWYGPDMKGKAAIFQPSTNKERECLATKATQNSRNREQVRDNPMHELIGKGEKKTIMNEGGGLESPFTTLKSFPSVWHYSLIWTDVGGFALYSICYLTRDKGVPAARAICPFTATQTLPPCLQWSLLTTFWTPVEKSRKNVTNSPIHQYIDNICLYIMFFIIHYLSPNGLPGILNRSQWGNSGPFLPNEPVTTTAWDYAEKKRDEHPRVI